MIKNRRNISHYVGLILLTALLAISTSTQSGSFNGIVKPFLMGTAVTPFGAGLAFYGIKKTLLLPRQNLAEAMVATGLGWYLIREQTRSRWQASLCTFGAYSVIGTGILTKPQITKFLCKHPNFGIGLGALAGSVVVGKLLSSGWRQLKKLSWPRLSITRWHAKTAEIDDGYQPPAPYASSAPPLETE